jgi:hypothetical protein
LRGGHGGRICAVLKLAALPEQVPDVDANRGSTKEHWYEQDQRDNGGRSSFAAMGNRSYDAAPVCTCHAHVIDAVPLMVGVGRPGTKPRTVQPKGVVGVTVTVMV